MTRLVLEEEADFVIVGTGAGGATAARVLSEAGYEVVMLEEGPELAASERPTDLLGAMSIAVRDMGTQSTVGATPIPLLQGKLVGGSTAINSGIIWRMPDDVREHWTREFGLGDLVDEAEQMRIYDILEDELEVDVTAPEVRGDNAHKMEEACRALGLPGKPITRNARRCKGRARCLQGCPEEARQSMDVSYIPRSIAHGARLHALCRAQKVLREDGRAIGVGGAVLDKGSGHPVGRFEARARRGVIMAAGAVHTPVILLKSGLRGMVGQRFQAHPGSAVVGRFPDVINMGFGATQGYEVPMRAQGFKIESLSLPPELLALRLPGVGGEWQARLGELNHYAQWVVQVRMGALGRVSAGWGGKPVVRYEPLDRDLRTMQRALALICRMMFAAGATEVFPGLGHAPEVLHDVSEVDALERAELGRADFHMMASHLFGTACAGADPRRSVVGPDLQSHELPGLYVMDASAFPTNLGVNPQHSIMTVVWRAAEQLANAGRDSAVA
jgi:choline dehydrogenase-like flavoprotein